MHVEGHQALSMVHHYTIAFEEEPPGQKNRAGVGGHHPGAARCMVIQTLVLGFQFAVKHPPDSERLRNWLAHRSRKIAMPLLRGAALGEDMVFEDFLFFNALQQSAVGSGEL